MYSDKSVAFITKSQKYETFGNSTYYVDSQVASQEQNKELIDYSTCSDDRQPAEVFVAWG